MAATGGLATGLICWSLAEYGAHRFVLHGRAGSGAIGAEHRMHHRTPLHTDPRRRAAGYGIVAAPALVGAALARSPTVLGAAVAWSLGYTVYEQLHWRFHHCSARTGWGARARQRHFAHHAEGSTGNYGVTTAVWDRAFATTLA